MGRMRLNPSMREEQAKHFRGVIDKLQGKLNAQSGAYAQLKEEHEELVKLLSMERLRADTLTAVMGRLPFRIALRVFGPAGVRIYIKQWRETQQKKVAFKAPAPAEAPAPTIAQAGEPAVVAQQPQPLADPREPGMLCEQHRSLPWPHDDCPGPGVPQPSSADASTSSDTPR